MATCAARTDLSATGGYRLDCSRFPGHTGLHFDNDYRLWWAAADERAVTSSGQTQTSAETALTDKIAAAVGGLGEDWRLKEHPEAERIGDMLEQLAARIRGGA
jgi:hypothetical protein